MRAEIVISTSESYAKPAMMTHCTVQQKKVVSQGQAHGHARGATTGLYRVAMLGSA